MRWVVARTGERCGHAVPTIIYLLVENSKLAPESETITGFTGIVSRKQPSLKLFGVLLGTAKLIYRKTRMPKTVSSQPPATLHRCLRPPQRATVFDLTLLEIALQGTFTRGTENWTVSLP
jgi:hypothetical protein